MIKLLQTGFVTGLIFLVSGLPVQATGTANRLQTPDAKEILFFCPSQRPENIINITAQHKDGNIILTFFSGIGSTAFNSGQVTLFYDNQNFNAENIVYSFQTTTSTLNFKANRTEFLSFWLPVSTFRQFANSNNMSVRFGPCPVFTQFSDSQKNYLRQIAQQISAQ